ncbi:hypothetical protein [Granulicella arctica]|uniref:hypothetical protein n=1 Tax=Granulicella arctica TaxID=940613 RepID=UPI0021E0A6BF|nr:hypothetical protein [Granulicella arctica]
MNASNERVLYYQADANPIGGYLTHPFSSVLHTDASVSLGQAGGHVAGRSEAFKLDDLIRTGSHYSQVTGSTLKTNGNWTILITSVVEDLNVLEVVTADRIVSRVALEYERAEGKYYPKISFVGAQYENLRISGTDVTPTLDLDILSAPAANQAPRSAAEGDILPAASPAIIEFPDTPWPDVQSFVRRAVDQSERIVSAKGVPEWLKRRYEWMADPAARARKGYIACSLVNEVPGAAPGSSFGHVVQVPDFGNVFLGELMIDPISYRLTMLRVEMGCFAEGNVSFASTGGGSSPMP